jgi:hypothetical protein
MDSQELTAMIRDLVDTGVMDWETAYKEAQLEMNYLMNVRVDNVNLQLQPRMGSSRYGLGEEEQVISLPEAEAEGYEDDED